MLTFVANIKFNKKKGYNMKTKTSIYYCTFVSLLCVAFIFGGCRNGTTNEPKKQNSDMFKFGIKTIEHDSCEYVVFKDKSRSAVTMVHKQNCKFCEERSKK
jgi:hypothetical protein